MDAVEDNASSEAALVSSLLDELVKLRPLVNRAICAIPVEDEAATSELPQQFNAIVDTACGRIPEIHTVFGCTAKVLEAVVYANSHIRTAIRSLLVSLETISLSKCPGTVREALDDYKSCSYRKRLGEAFLSGALDLFDSVKKLKASKVLFPAAIEDEFDEVGPFAKVLCILLILCCNLNRFRLLSCCL